MAIYLVAMAFFQLWAIVIFPRLVTVRRDYLNLICLNLLICMALLAVCIVSIFHPLFTDFSNWLLDPNASKRLIVISILLILFPLAAIIATASSVLILWKLRIFLYGRVIRISRKAVEKYIANLRE
jgi:hypothetical protein